MTKGGLRLQATFRIPHEAFRDEVDKEVIVAAENLLQSLGARTSPAALRINDWSGSACLVYTIGKDSLCIAGER